MEHLDAEVARELLRHAPDPVSVSRAATGEFIAVNDAFVELVGLRREQLIGHTSVELGITDPAERAATMQQLVGLGGTLPAVDFRIRRVDGTALVVSLSATLYEDPEQSGQLLLLFMRDVSAQREAERYRDMHRNVLGLLAADLDWPQFRDAMMESVARTLGWAGGVAWEQSEDPVELEVTSVWTADSFEDLAPQLRTAVRDLRVQHGQGIVGSSWAMRSTVWEGDLARSRRVRPLKVAPRLGIHSIICVPIVGASHRLAAIEFFDTQRHPPIEEQLALLDHIGRLVGHAAVRRSTIESERRHVRELTSRYERATRDYETVVRHRMFNPLAVVEGVLRTIADQPDLSAEVRGQLIDNALDACMRMREVTLEPLRQGSMESGLEPSP